MVELKIKAETIGELLPFVRAEINHGILWELRHNFRRKFKHIEPEGKGFFDGIYMVLNELTDEISEFLDEEYGG